MRTFDKLTDSTTYVVSTDLEAIIGAYALLSGKKYTLFEVLYGSSQLDDWERRYQFLFETYHAVKELAGAFLLEFLLDFFDERFDIETFEQSLLKMSEAERVWRLMKYFVETSEVSDALDSDESLSLLYTKVQRYTSSYLGFQSFVRNSDRYVKEFFSLARKLKTPVLEKLLEEQGDRLESFQKTLRAELNKKDPLILSQEWMGKTFRNKGPYKRYYFIPSWFLPAKYLRLFDDDRTINGKQFLFCHLGEKKRSQKQLVYSLKAFSDDTRYTILTTLAEFGPLKGQEMAKRLNLTPSTVSHHMAGLVESGLVIEEPVKTAKFYSLSKQAINHLLETISEDLKLNTK
ncbi:ArsR/SmtB family transcription factor [Streptococcus moroccensis]|uniref:DNA-binding transcriptional ArsR family regulator n=1 Tax=Streptococcus moroccensis TaxID=1451356 RepID=A0ABT9YTA5_9STRE|nr:metalloregulator ArsR/SmtB family transcription factor [Streptococcus moroccensis]MDQ0223226.1 DNA-binding transcriptional ArsR family regulator [Streptococcus moroccensis]